MMFSQMEKENAVVVAATSYSSSSAAAAASAASAAYAVNSIGSTSVLSATAANASSRKTTKKRLRANLSEQQRREMERLFGACKYPDYHELEALGRTVGLPYRKVLVWFKNRRAKDKRTRKVDYGPYDFALGATARFSESSAVAAAASVSVSTAAETKAYCQQTLCTPMQQHNNNNNHHHQQQQWQHDIHQQYQQYQQQQHLQNQQQQQQYPYYYYSYSPTSVPQETLMTTPAMPLPQFPRNAQHSLFFASPPTPEFPPASPPSRMTAAAAAAAAVTAGSGLVSASARPVESPACPAAGQYPPQPPPRARYISEFIAANNGSTPMMMSRML